MLYIINSQTHSQFVFILIRFLSVRIKGGKENDETLSSIRAYYRQRGKLEKAIAFSSIASSHEAKEISINLTRWCKQRKSTRALCSCAVVVVSSFSQNQMWIWVTGTMCISHGIYDSQLLNSKVQSSFIIYEVFWRRGRWLDEQHQLKSIDFGSHFPACPYTWQSKFFKRLT